jgi:outer membrane biosynthesis protein TonB
MNVHWVRSNEVLLSLLAIVIVTVCVLTALVVHQQHVQRTIPHAPRTAIVPDLANASGVPAHGDTPAQPAPQLSPVPAEAVAPQVPRAIPIRHKPLQPKARPQRFARPVPAVHRPVPVQPAIQAPANDPVTQPAPPANPDRTPRKIDTPSKSEPSTGYSDTPTKKGAPGPAAEGTMATSPPQPWTSGLIGDTPT